jgi:hypothetical protein
VNYDPPTPVERVLARKRWIRWIAGLLVIIGVLYYLIFVNQYIVAYKNPDDHFRYGSIGSETANGLPILVFKALPVMFRDQLGPTGYRRFGLLYETEQSDLPVGMSRRVVSGVERVWLNCAVCHVGTYRLALEDQPIRLYGAPANNLRLYDLISFFLRVGNDPRFTADNLIATINGPEVNGKLNFINRLIYRYIVFPRVQAALQQLAQRISFVNRQADWGPGRVDTFNPYKAIQFNFPMDAAQISDTELNGSSDYPAIWQQQPREGMHLHWDGNNTSVDERNLRAALGAGVTPLTIDIDAIHRVRDWIWTLAAPPFPVPAAIDAAKADHGRQLFAEYCASCHGMRNGSGHYTNRYPRLGQIEPLDSIGTDPDRWQSYTQNFSAAQNMLYAGYPWRFTHFRKTGGYANQPLDGIWARSPYLHNGSVPTLRDLLDPSGCLDTNPCQHRPDKWYRGSDILDTAKVGYQYNGYGYDVKDLFLYDTSIPGNSNRGHEGKTYGTDLPDADKDDIVEYMKTL